MGKRDVCRAKRNGPDGVANVSLTSTGRALLDEHGRAFAEAVWTSVDISVFVTGACQHPVGRARTYACHDIDAVLRLRGLRINQDAVSDAKRHTVNNQRGLSASIGQRCANPGSPVVIRRVQVGR